MPEPLFTIRPAQERDLPILALLFTTADMPVPPRDDLLVGTVAVNGDDEPVGFIRILVVSDEVNPAGSGAYVYPVVVFDTWRGHGVGAALVSHELIRYHELKLVGCRDSRGFYPRIGFEPLEWDGVAGVIARDCERCGDLQACDPQPFIGVHHG